MEKGDPKDKFWDIEELLPSRPEKKHAKSPVFCDTEAVEIEVAEKTEACGTPIPPRVKKDPRERRVLREYECAFGFIQKVSVSPWPTEFGFYKKFRKDAIRYFEREHAPCEYVYFFSYMPQYDQMTISQLSYYLYWRGEIRKGLYIKTDINYLFLYAYEIINLPDRIPPKKGAVELTRLWAAYRDDFRYLDKYLGEWLCDYCLIHRVEPDWVTLDCFSGEVASKVSMPEFYLHGGDMTWELIQNLAAYDYKTSKYYPDHAREFDLHIPRAMESAVKREVAPRLADYGIGPMRMLRDSFSGAVACHDVKFKITVMCTPLRRSLELKQALTGMIKLCENNLRAAFGIKSRFSPGGVSEQLKTAISDYFDGVYPERNLKKRKPASALEEESYMALYEPENKGPADIFRALEIEAAAWETAELLEMDEEEQVSDAPMPMMPSEEMPKDTVLSEDTGSIAYSEMPEEDFSFVDHLEPFLKNALKAAAEGSFEAFCRKEGKMAEMVRGAINEEAADAIGDIIIEEDFSLVSDYRQELLRAINET